MIFRRFALAVGLVFAALASQLPEYTQQYRQRLGGAIDELNATVETFDGQAAAQSLSRDQAIARLESAGILVDAATFTDNGDRTVGVSLTLKARR